MTYNWSERLNAGDSIQHEQQDTAQAAKQASQRNCEPILIVDDDLDWASECAFTMHVLGFEPLMALTPEEAIAHFDKQTISIAIIDYNMPGKDGITLAQELTRTAQERGNQLNVIMATGYATKDIAVDAMRASAVDFLEKPVRQEDLRKSLQRIKGLQNGPGGPERLLSRLSKLTSELHQLSSLIDPKEPQAAAPLAPAEVSSQARLARQDFDQIAMCEFIRGQLRKEAKRRSIGPDGLFGDPAWEMLLDLLLAKFEGHTVSVSSACIASGAPMSTALRLVRRLVDEKVLCRIPDEHDKRRHFLLIDPSIEETITEYLKGRLSENARHQAEA